MDGFVSRGFVDSFRAVNQEPHHYSWWSYRAGARGKNLGWRIDYQMVSEALAGKIQHASILPDVKHSDHCPIVLLLNS
jgi:exodeoxyribonuclease-3